jgi:ABC-type nitrate/sulfonate/bicarbonate transport system substrate-binding protein
MITVKRVIICALVALLPTAALAQERQVRIGHNRAWHCVPLILGITEGFFDRAGVAIAEKIFNNPADIIQAIASGDLDAGISPSGMLFTALPRGVNLRGVAVGQGPLTPPVTFMARTDSGISSQVDLRGKTVAMAGFGGTTDLFLRYWLTRGDVDPKNDLKIMFVPYHLMLPSLINRQVASAPIDPALANQARREFPGQVKKLFDYEDITTPLLGNKHVNGLILNFGGAFIDRDRETAVRFMEGYLRAVRATKDNPKWAIERWAVASKSDEVRTFEVLPGMPDDGKIYMGALQFEADLALKFGYISQPADIQRAVDNSLLDEAARRLR